MENIRVMTYNIQHGEGLDGRVDIGRIAAAIRAGRADIVAPRKWTGVSSVPTR